jgi:hypothetical protein
MTWEFSPEHPITLIFILPPSKLYIKQMQIIKPLRTENALARGEVEREFQSGII